MYPRKNAPFLSWSTRSKFFQYVIIHVIKCVCHPVKFLPVLSRAQCCSNSSLTCNSHLQHTSTELTNSHNRRNIFVAIEAVDVMACIWLEEDRRLKLTLYISSLSFSSDMIIVLIGTRQDALCHHVVSKIVLNFRRLPDHMTHDEKKMNLLSSGYVKILVDKASKIV